MLQVTQIPSHAVLCKKKKIQKERKKEREGGKSPCVSRGSAPSPSPGRSSISGTAWRMPKRAQELGDIVGGIYPVCFWPLSPTITLLPV